MKKTLTLKEALEAQKLKTFINQNKDKFPNTPFKSKFNKLLSSMLDKSTEAPVTSEPDCDDD